ncbi:MAG: T9SS type A sorting domain-containing protein [Phycisphaerae bacterium]|nr:T9SS type A sorting domain-containing protein [Saprospiraceae bacterium]
MINTNTYILKYGTALRPALWLIAALCAGFSANAQAPINWSQEIAPILYKNCVSCHRPGQIAPFDLITYQDAYDNQYSIQEAVEHKSMPPWPPDPSFRHFVQERLLTQGEIDKIADWVNQGAPEGDPGLAPPIPTFPSGGQFGTPDLKWQIPTYTVNMPAGGDDLYRCFVIHNDMPDTAFMSLMEVVPGNRNIVHHILVYQDTTGGSAAADALDPEPGFISLGPGGILVGEWVPGQKFLPTPEGMAFRIYPGSDIVVQVHYPQGSQGEVDSTYLNIYLTDPDANGGIRELSTDSPLNYIFPSWLAWLTNSYIEPWPLLIPANESKKFVARYTMTKDVSVLGVSPHAHYINKSFEVIGVTPLGDIINFIKIPDWEFHWQGFYYYPKPVFVPSGTILFAKTVYDNTSDNDENPFDPPQDIPAGEATTEEMLLVYFTYMDYRPGDENLVLYDSTIYTHAQDSPLPNAVTIVASVNCVPNPANNTVQIVCDLKENLTLLRLEILDLNGRLVEQMPMEDVLAKGRQTWSCQVANYLAGTYFVRLTTEQGTVSTQFVVLH